MLVKKIKFKFKSWKFILPAAARAVRCSKSAATLLAVPRDSTCDSIIVTVIMMTVMVITDYGDYGDGDQGDQGDYGDGDGDHVGCDEMMMIIFTVFTCTANWESEYGGGITVAVAIVLKFAWDFKNWYIRQSTPIR